MTKSTLGRNRYPSIYYNLQEVEHSFCEVCAILVVSLCYFLFDALKNQIHGIEKSKMLIVILQTDVVCLLGRKSMDGSVVLATQSHKAQTDKHIALYGHLDHIHCV